MHLDNIALLFGILTGLCAGDIAVTLQRNLPSYSKTIQQLKRKVDTSVSYFVPRDADGAPLRKKTSWIPVYGASIEGDGERMAGITWSLFTSLLLLTRTTGIASMIGGWDNISSVIGAMIIPISAAIMMITIASIDMEYRIIPNQANLILFLLSLLFFALKLLNGTWVISMQFDLSIMGAVAVIMFLSSFIPGNKGIGMGDVKTIVALMPILGASSVVMLFAASISSALYSLWLIVSKRKDWRRIPFGPFLAFGYLVACTSSEAFAKMLSSIMMAS